MRVPFRLRAFFVHLGLSLTVALASLALVFWVWYKPPLNIAIGVDKIVLILLSVDMVLGPLLTLILAKEHKKSLKFDLAVVALLQLSAYGYGMAKIAEGRPVWLVFDTRRFEIAQAALLDESEQDQVAEAYRTPTLGRAKWVSVRPPKDNEEKSARLFYELGEGFPPSARPALYAPLSDAWSAMQAKMKPLDELHSYNSDKAQVEKILQKHPQADGYLPMLAPQVSEDMTVLLNMQEKSVVAVVNLRPW